MKLIVLNIDDTLINSTIIQPIINNQLMTLGGYASLALPTVYSSIIVNVSLSNNGGDFNNISSFRFGKNLFLLVFMIFIIDIAGAVTNITSFLSNCTNINVFWNSSALNYTFEIYDGTTNQLLRSVSVYNTSYHFESTESELFIYCYKYVITAVNQLGEGLSYSAMFSYQTGRSIVYNIFRFYDNNVL